MSAMDDDESTIFTPWNFDLVTSQNFGVNAILVTHQQPDDTSHSKEATSEVKEQGSSSKDSKHGKVTTKKPKGLRSPYAYFIKYSREQLKKANPNMKVDFGDFTKNCAQKWHKMTPEEKQPFHDLTKKDKVRYVEEMKNYVPPPKEKKKKKDKNGPLRPLTPFFWFCDAVRPIVKSQNPDFKLAEMSKELSRRWKLLETKKRAKYYEMHRLDNERYTKEMKVFEALQKSKLKQSPLEKRKPLS